MLSDTALPNTALPDNTLPDTPLPDHTASGFDSQLPRRGRPRVRHDQRTGDEPRSLLPCKRTDALARGSCNRESLGLTAVYDVRSETEANETPDIVPAPAMYAHIPILSGNIHAEAMALRTADAATAFMQNINRSFVADPSLGTDSRSCSPPWRPPRAATLPLTARRARTEQVGRQHYCRHSLVYRAKRSRRTTCLTTRTRRVHRGNSREDRRCHRCRQGRGDPVAAFRRRELPGRCLRAGRAPLRNR